MIDDLRHAVRMLARNPGHSAAVGVVLALGIGACAVVFSITNAVLVRPLPFEADGLVVAWSRDDTRAQPMVELSYPDLRAIRDGTAVLRAVAGMPAVDSQFVLGGREEPVPLAGRFVTEGFFTVLGAEPALGRTFMAVEHRPGSPRTVVVSHGLWQRLLDGRTEIVGQAIELGGEAFTVVGVMPADFAFPFGAELWTPVEPANPGLIENGDVRWLHVVARHEPAATPERIQAELDTLLARIDAEQGARGRRSAVVTPASDVFLGPSRVVLLAVSAAVGLVLLIACANVGSLTLVRGSGRRREIAVRRALGAGRARIVRQLLAESAVLASAGGAAGLALAYWSTGAVVRLIPVEVPRLSAVAVDGTVLGFVTIVCGIAIAVGGLPAAWHVGMSSSAVALRDGRAATASRPDRRMQSAIIVGEVALAVMLIVGAGLLGRSLVALSRVELGFEPDRLLSLEIGSSPAERGAEGIPRHRAFIERALERVEALPDVSRAGAVLLRPLWGTVGMDWPYTVEGQAADDALRNPLVNLEAITPGYLETMGIQVLSGRDFDARDTESTAGVAIVSASLARRSWPDGDAVGRRLKMPLPDSPFHDTWLTVVGVVEDARYRAIETPRHDVYLSFRQANLRLRHLVVRTVVSPTDAVASVRAALREVAPGRAIDDVRTMSDVVSGALGVPRFGAQLFGAFALLAALLATVGLFAVVAHSVRERTREIGVRVAIGARPVQVVRLVLGGTMTTVALGLALGLVGAIVAGRLLEGVLYGVASRDPLALLAAPATLVVAAALASYLPVRRALAIQPSLALRDE